MNRIVKISNFQILVVLTFLLIACESEKRVPPKGYIPNVPEVTDQLEAAYFWVPQNQLKSAYWKDADYVEVSLSDLQTGKLYDDGFLNMTGTFSGLSGFNRGKNPKVKLKAGYDEEYLYIMVEWKDTTANASYMSWLWDGPKDFLKEDTATGWTSQRNNDNLSLIFDKDITTEKDVWRWNLANSAPFDMAYNLKINNTNDLILPDNIIRNTVGNSSRSGPSNEWNGERQEIILSDGTKKLLDPGYYLLDSLKTNFLGNAKEGQYIFNSKADCKYCHGQDGNGESDESNNGGSLRDVFTNRLSRVALADYIGSDTHDGAGDQYWGNIKNNPTDITNLLAFLRSIAGVPGYSIIKPSSEPAIKALTNIGLGTINPVNSQYTVLFRRKLITDNTADIQFLPGSTYTFSIRLSDNDDMNYIGAVGLKLTFKSNSL